MRVKYITYFFVYLTVIFCGYAQNSNLNIDKNLLEKILISTENPEWIKEDLIFKSFTREYDEIEKILAYYKKEPTSKKKVVFYLFLGGYNYNVTENYNAAQEHLKYCLEHIEFLTTLQKHDLYHLLAEIEKIQSNFINSIFFYEKNLDLAQKNNNTLELYKTYRELGVVFREISQLELAEKYLLKSTELANTIGIKEDVAWNMLHLATLYMQKKEYNTSYKYFQKGLEIAKQQQQPIIENFIYLDYIKYWIETNNLENAKHYANKLLKTALNKENSSTTPFIETCTYDLQGKIALIEKDTIKAVEYSKISFDKANQLGVSGIARISAQRIIKCTPISSDLHKNMLNYVIESFETQESFLKKYRLYAEQIDEVNNIENKIKLLNKRSNNRVISLILLLGFTTALIIAIYKLSKKKKEIANQTEQLLEINEKIQNNNAKLAQINEDLNQFSSVVSHDIKSSIVGLQYSLKKIKQSTKIEQLNLKEELLSLEKEINQLYQYVDYLMFASKNAKTTSVIPQKIDFYELFIQLEDNYRGKLNFPISFSYIEKDIDFKGYKIQIFKLLKALTEISVLNNIQEKPLTIKISISKTKNNVLEINFYDNGPLIDPNSLKMINYELENLSDISLNSNIGINYLVCQKIISTYNGWFQIFSNSKTGNLKCVELEEK